MQDDIIVWDPAHFVDSTPILARMSPQVSAKELDSLRDKHHIRARLSWQRGEMYFMKCFASSGMQITVCQSHMKYRWNGGSMRKLER